MSAVVQFAWRHASAAVWNEVEEQTQVRSVLSPVGVSYRVRDEKIGARTSWSSPRRTRRSARR